MKSRLNVLMRSLQGLLSKIKYDLLMTNVQKISQEIDGHVQRMATLDNELLDLHAALRLQKPITEPPPPEGPMPTVQEMPPQAPDLPETMADDLDMTPRGLSEEDRDEGSSGASKKIRVCVPQDACDVESWVTGLPQDLLLLFLSRGQEGMKEREIVQNCHDVDELLQGGLDG